MSALNWREISFFGCGPEDQQRILAQKFEFPTLEATIEREFSRNPARKAFIWNTIQINIEHYVLVPVTLIVFVDEMIPPLIRDHSVQLQTNTEINLATYGIDWTPHPSNNRIFTLPSIDVLTNHIFDASPYIVRSNQAEIRELTNARLDLFNYVHINYTFEFSDEQESGTSLIRVAEFFSKSGKLETHLKHLAREYKISEANVARFKALARETIERTRLEEIEKIDRAIERMENLSPAIRESEIVKVYPVHPHVDISPMVSRQFNSALGRIDRVEVPIFPTLQQIQENILEALENGEEIYGQPQKCRQEEEKVMTGKKEDDGEVDVENKKETGKEVELAVDNDDKEDGDKKRKRNKRDEDSDQDEELRKKRCLTETKPHEDHRESP
eukprot:TRINITY_DN6548_c0_g1_i1.p1 TRINITY_DN6548_c0_g1~~TRINITY_DN6548_c0_g1_i1.p1  ORF type:complete len:386 (+),score=74.57 TRINITY_DN6548_c0_g1_i1:201-1358(+)